MRSYDLDQQSKGFTIVELLIVIVVIAILAAISIVAYSGIQERAADSTMKSEIANIIKQLEVKRVTLGDRYPQNSAEMSPLTINKDAYDKTQNNLYYCLDITTNTYSVGVRAKNLKGYMISNGEVTEVAHVHGLATCEHIGLTTWGSNTTQAVLQGYASSTGNYASYLQ